MYFEDIFEKVKPLWKESFSLDDIEHTKTYVKDIMKNYQAVERIIDFTHKEEYSEWHSMFMFTMYQPITNLRYL